VQSDFQDREASLGGRLYPAPITHSNPSQLLMYHSGMIVYLLPGLYLIQITKGNLVGNPFGLRRQRRGIMPPPPRLLSHLPRCC
jgi:hypothetical protein